MRFRTETFGAIRTINGDSAEVLKTVPDASVDSVVTDPPYALVSIGKRFGADNAAPAKAGKSGAYARASAGFMGQKWDTGETAFAVEFWQEVLRVLKPGGHVLAFGGTRTYHRLVCAIEDAGFEIRDQIAWLYGAGFPKSHQLDKQRGVLICGCDDEGQTVSERNLRPVRRGDVPSPVHLASERGQVLQSGLPEQGASRSMLRAEPVEGGAGGGECGLEGRRNSSAPTRKLRERALRPLSAGPSTDGAEGWLHHGTSARDGAMGGALPDPRGDGASSGSQADEQLALQSGAVAGQPESQAGGAWPLCGGCGKPRVVRGLGTALKPALEPIVVARKPLQGTVAANVLTFGTGALNIDASRVEMAQDDAAKINAATYRNSPSSVAIGKFASEGTDKPMAAHPKGRWPANVIHDGSEEVVGAFPERDGAVSNGRSGDSNGYGGGLGKQDQQPGFGDSGSAARFFYSAKADAEDRLGSKHPTVKPADLMAYLCRLVTPPGGTVLDPFAGSGSTGVACVGAGFAAILIEREETYFADIGRRIAWAQGNGGLTAQEIVRGKQVSADGLPLFSEQGA